MGKGAPAAPLKRLIRNAFGALAAIFLFTPASAAAPQRIIAVGDLHGDYEAWLAIARAAGLIDAAAHWAGGKTTLVQLGDVTDRGPNSLQIIRNLQQLQVEATRSGGRVVVLLGNHEAMNLLGDLRYVSAGEFAAFADNRAPARRERLYASLRKKLEAEARKIDFNAQPSQVRDAWLTQHPLGWVEHRNAWKPSGPLGRWATANPAVAMIDGTLFVHGGLSGEYARLTLEDINRRAAAAMTAADDRPSSILNDPLGPLWYRGLVLRDADAQAARDAAVPHQPQLTPEQELDAVLAAYRAQRLVIAHTPDLKGIQLLFGGRLARIDTGISKAYGGTLSWLEIAGGKAVAHSIGRPSP